MCEWLLSIKLIFLIFLVNFFEFYFVLGLLIFKWVKVIMKLIFLDFNFFIVFLFDLIGFKKVIWIEFLGLFVYCVLGVVIFIILILIFEFSVLIMYGVNIFLFLIVNLLFFVLIFLLIVFLFYIMLVDKNGILVVFFLILNICFKL